jgi:hypothetical protein
MKKIFKVKNLHLLISALIVGLAGLAYGLYPNQILPLLFDFKIETVDLNNVFRAIMGLYLALAFYWLYGVCNIAYWRQATLSNVIFIAGLAFGRIVSIIIDGWPSLAFSIGTFLEVMVVIWGVFNLKKYSLNE